MNQILWDFISSVRYGMYDNFVKFYCYKIWYEVKLWTCFGKNSIASFSFSGFIFPGVYKNNKLGLVWFDFGLISVLRPFNTF